MGEPRFWVNKHHPLSLVLIPLSWLYHGLEASRRAFTHAHHPGKPVICVGNLTAGGTGKTPTVQLVCGWLEADGYHPAILSRGYGGREKGPLKVDPTRHSAVQVGDEPLMLAAHWPVYIGADRQASLRLAVQEGADAMVKDDGFQNPTMAHHFNLIVVDGTSGFGNGRLLPAGPLRQPLATALERLDALLIVGEATHASLAPLLAELARRNKPVFYARLEATQKGDGQVHAFCGIAKPEKFRASLRAQGYEVVQETHFADHHNFTEAEAEALLVSSVRLITTQKDMARLASAPHGTACARLAETAMVLPIALRIDNGDALHTRISDAIAAKQGNQRYQSYS